MEVLIVSGIVFLLLNFGMHCYRKGDRTTPAVTLLISIVLIALSC